MEGILKKLERYCATARPMLGGEVYLTGEEVCSQLQLSTRTLQEYRNAGILPFYKIEGKILYKQSDIQTTRVRDKKSLEKVGNLVKNSYLYRWKSIDYKIFERWLPRTKLLKFSV